MTLEEYKAEIDRRVAVMRQELDEDLAAAKRGVWCADRMNLNAWGISLLSRVRTDLDDIDWMQL